MPDIKQNCRVCSKEFTVNEWEQAHLQKMGGVTNGIRWIMATMLVPYPLCI